MPTSDIARKENTMLTPTVVEIRRGSPRGVITSPATPPTPPRS
jgi:hypothetical protein